MSTPLHHRELAYYRAVARAAPSFERTEEVELLRRWKNLGDRRAADSIARAHLRVVIGLALQYRHYNVPITELIAEGNFGVAQALRKYDPERGVRFKTYANHWVHACILEYVVRTWSVVGGATGAVRSRLFFKLRRERSRMQNLMGESAASDEALAGRLGMRVERVRSLLGRLDCRDLSLETPIGDASNERVVDRLESAHDPEQSCFEAEVVDAVKQAVDHALARLDARERYIAQRRMMADADEELSLAEIARRMGVSRERARQLEARAKRKLRESFGSLADSRLRDWLAHGSAGFAA